MLGAMTMPRSQWEKLVEAWRGSGQTARVFAAAHGVTDASLRYWATRLADEDGEADAPKGRRRRQASSVAPPIARLVRPGEMPPATRTGRIMVVVGKASIVVEPGFDGAHLRDVVHALGEAG